MCRSVTMTDMSSPQLRRQDRLLGDAEARALLVRGYCGRVGSIGADGWPYVVPLLYVFAGDEITLHNSAARDDSWSPRRMVCIRSIL